MLCPSMRPAGLLWATATFPWTTNILQTSLFLILPADPIPNPMSNWQPFDYACGSEAHAHGAKNPLQRPRLYFWNQHLIILKQPGSKEKEEERFSLGCSQPHHPWDLPPERAAKGRGGEAELFPLDFVKTRSPGKSRNNQSFHTKLALAKPNKQDEDAPRRRPG